MKNLSDEWTKHNYNLLLVIDTISVLSNFCSNIQKIIKPTEKYVPFWFWLETELNATISQLNLIRKYYSKIEKDKEWNEGEEIETFLVFNEILFNFLKNLLILVYKKFEIIKTYNQNVQSNWMTDFLVKLRNLLFHSKINSFSIEELINSAVEFNFFCNERIRELKLNHSQKNAFSTFNFLLDEKNTIMFGNIKSNINELEIKELDLTKNDIDLKYNYFNSPKFEIIDKLLKEKSQLIVPTVHYKLSRSTVSKLTRFSDPNCWVLYIQLNDLIIRIEMYPFLYNVLNTITWFI